MSDVTQVQQLAAFAAGCRDDLPAHVAEDVTNRILDTVGNMLAGRAEATDRTDSGLAVSRAVQEWGGRPQASVIGAAQRLPAVSAALVNGAFAHALDFDVTHLPSVLHPSASVVPAALAAAESVRARGTDVVAAVAAGIEICNRLGMASYLPSLRNSLFFEKGFHATSICGTIGAAVAAGMLYGLDADGLASAIGVAASMGAGILEANRTGDTVKKIHCGWAAHGGIAAAAMAREGVTGPPTVLEGRFGFFAAYLDGQYDSRAMLDDLGTRWELLRTVYKPYPSNHFTHPGIDCALALRAGGLDPADIADIELGVAGPTLRTIGEPRAAKVRPASAYHAKFSGPFTVATALLGGGGLGVYLDDFVPGAEADPARLALADRVTCVDDPRASEIFPNAFAAVLTVRTRGGAVLSHRVDSSRGGPEHPLTLADHRLKFRLNAGRALPEERVAQLEEAATALAGGEPVDRLLALTLP
ncbi:MmgE/PrpD family protein [Dactylosporangium roseum]|uniref:MmgE/PrpD family protein n=1 Tax=Dactylosporangium roseum TaxID=47989 RepID=A0ABY5YZG1_9ACTN|nr:MmgE/PrpD family protein [Dactylosporangium roseum]UWZ34243.1 MmgE/PrpD family protein [Dactylosporangium roseum]